MIQLVIVKVSFGFDGFNANHPTALTSQAMYSHITPGCLVRHPSEFDWGIGQVQSVVGNRVTVNFENAGKRVINCQKIDLILISTDPRG